MMRRLTVALLLMLMVALAAAAPVAGARKGFFVDVTATDWDAAQPCRIWGYVSWWDYPSKDYYVEVRIVEDGVDRIIETSGPVGSTGTFETAHYALTVFPPPGSVQDFYVVAKLIRAGQHDKVVATGQSGAYSLHCTAIE